ncbi:13326_t:CDS:2 [Cetraspora pellucida]|uniref:13326_t:CDS:1 n=1 Tax=Cetraspora pellucida TaxID=1433469 RepID=A0A9N8Z2S6_9GLOM|nr:13326_t:CDS:2 [Cetraspora pellucida]
MANIQSKDDLLRELNYKLVAEIDKLRKENAEILKLKKKYTEIETENIELKAKNMKVKADNAEGRDKFSSLQLISNLSTVNSYNTPISLEDKMINDLPLVESEKVDVVQLSHDFKTVNDQDESKTRSSASPTKLLLNQKIPYNQKAK